MAQSQKAKPPPLDILQSMVNGILIEIGRALRSSDKDSGRTFTSASTRLQSTLPSAANNFHQALDDLEIDILRAKAVILRDLEGQRAQRIAREAPIEVLEPDVVPDVEPAPTEPLPKVQRSAPSSPQKEDALTSLIDDTSSVPQPTVIDTVPPHTPALQRTKSQQGPTPPASNQPTSKPIGLGINTEAIPTPPAQEPSGVPQSSVDSLFDVPENDNGDSMINFDDMDFSIDASATQNPDQTQNNTFDLSTFGNDTQDFAMLDLTGGDEANPVADTGTKLDDIFDDLGTNTGGDTMDLDLGNMDMGEGNSFDDLFLPGDDDGPLGVDGEMEHGQFDRAYFGLDE